MQIPMDARIIVKNIKTGEQFFYCLPEKYFKNVSPNSICVLIDMKDRIRKVVRSYLTFVESISETVNARILREISQRVQSLSDIGRTGNETETDIPISSEGGQEESE